MNWKKYNQVDLKSRYLYKFLSESNLEKFLKTGNIWFSRSDVFGDKMECVLIEDLLNKYPDFSKIEKRKMSHLISCFHYGNNETLAFWDTYTKVDKDRRKYALRFDRKDLLERVESHSFDAGQFSNINHLVHGRVKYFNLINSNKSKLENKKIKYTAFRKEYAFKYEREFRFDIKLDSKTEKKGYDLFIGKPDTIDFSIIVNPLLDNIHYVDCIAKIDEFGYSKKFKMSALAKWLKPDELWK